MWTLKIQIFQFDLQDFKLFTKSVNSITISVRLAVYMVVMEIDTAAEFRCSFVMTQRYYKRDYKE